MEELLTYIHNSQAPFFAVLVIGLLIALNPCQLAISFSALTYLYHHEGRKTALQKGLVFALGKAATYSLLGLVLMMLIHLGIGTERLLQFRHWEGLETLERILPFLLVLIALFFLYRAFAHHHHHNDSCHNSGTVIHRRGHSGAFFLGMLLALLFCPESAVMYFGITIPLCLTSSQGWLLMLLFALATTLPVLLLTYLMVATRQGAHRFSHRMEHLQQWLNILSALLFIAFAIYLWVE